MEKTAVAILNWNGINFLKQFLPPLIQYTKNATIVVIDNQSTDDSITYLKEYHPEVEIVINKLNGGYAKGYNDGFKKLRGRFDYYALINSDIEVTENWLSPLIFKLESNEKIAGVQPKVLSHRQRDYFEHAGASGGFIDKNFFPFCRGRIFDTTEKDNGQYDTEKEVFWTTGACMVVRAEIYHQLGGLDEHFFAHMEEIDFCWRAKRQGFSFFVVPQSTVYHVGGGTLQYASPRKTFLNFRNSLYMIHKNYEGWLFGKIFYRLCLDGIAGVKYLLSFKFSHTWAIVKSHFAYYGHLSVLCEQRKFLKKESSHFNPEGLYQASILWAYYFKKNRSFEAINKRFFK